MFEIRPYSHRGYRGGYDPFCEMENLERYFFGVPERRSFSSFRTDITDEGESYMIKADLPGFDKSDIAIDINGDSMVISAERSNESTEENKEKNYLRCERSYGVFKRKFDISGINADEIKASYVNGVLSVELPKKEKTQPESRRLEIE